MQLSCKFLIYNPCLRLWGSINSKPKGIKSVNKQQVLIKCICGTNCPQGPNIVHCNVQNYQFYMGPMLLKITPIIYSSCPANYNI